MSIFEQPSTVYSYSQILDIHDSYCVLAVLSDSTQWQYSVACLEYNNNNILFIFLRQVWLTASAVGGTMVLILLSFLPL